MKKIMCIAISALVLLGAAPKNTENDALRDSKGNINVIFDETHFPIYGIHKKLELSCKGCHLEKEKKEYSSAMNKSCQKYHGGLSTISRLRKRART